MAILEHACSTKDILLLFVFVLSLRLAQVCVHYPEYTIFTPTINYLFTMQVCTLVYIHARLFTPCPPLRKYK
jgi:hypothetical protein